MKFRVAMVMPVIVPMAAPVLVAMGGGGGLMALAITTPIHFTGIWGSLLALAGGLTGGAAHWWNLRPGRATRISLRLRPTDTRP